MVWAQYIFIIENNLFTSTKLFSILPMDSVEADDEIEIFILLKLILSALL